MDKVEQHRMLQGWIQQCESSDQLTEWEENFVKSLKKQLDNKGSLSAKQIEILERIYAEKTS